MVPCQPVSLYGETVVKVLGSARIPKILNCLILTAFIATFYTNVKSSTKYNEYIEGEEYPLIARLMFAKREMANYICNWDPDCKYFTPALLVKETLSLRNESRGKITSKEGGDEGEFTRS